MCKGKKNPKNKKLTISIRDMKESFVDHFLHRFSFCRTRTTMSIQEKKFLLESWNKRGYEKTNACKLCNMSQAFLNLRKKSRWMSHKSFAGSKAISCPWKEIQRFTLVIYCKIMHATLRIMIQGMIITFTLFSTYLQRSHKKCQCWY